MSRRLTDLHLPPRVYFKAGRYRYLDRANKWHTLGREWDRAARELHDKLARGTADPQTVSAMLDGFLKYREQQVRAGEAAARTLLDNEQEAKTLRLVFGHMPPNAVKRPHVARFLRERTDHQGRPAPVRANREAALLSSAYSWAMGLREWDIQENPCYGVRRNRERPRHRYIETGELARWKPYAPKWLRGYVLLKRLSGARQCEMLTLSRASLTDRGIRFQVSKTGRVKIVRWSWALRATVDALLALHKPARRDADDKVIDFPKPLEQQPLFISRRGEAMSASGLKSAWADAMAAYRAVGGERFRENDIRAKSASDLSTARAQELLDHASPAITKRTYQRAPAKVRPLR